jgi:signal transduction histidine kinase
MSEQEFLNRWLVVGTDSKLAAEETPREDRLGLPKRARQGQKGIGRLSCAALGPMALIISKRKEHPFVGALLDWRFFQNPYLLLHDIELPVVSFDHRKELPGLLDAMADRLVANVWGDQRNKDRNKRIDAAWKAFDDYEARQARPSTRQAIEQMVIRAAFADRHFSKWPVWNDTATSGTLMLTAGIVYDLTALLESEDVASRDSLVGDARERMFRTLSSFVDPFIARANAKDEFHYRITTWRDEEPTAFLSDERDFDFSTFETLEHIIEGEVDARGVFKGRVKAFGKWLRDHVAINPRVGIPTGSQTKVGPFRFRTGAYEGTRINSTLSDAEFAFVDAQAERYGGLFLFRDGLRVLPFGRPDNDFFEIERRRTTALGREFWSYRRMFGSISISSANNPNLRDKAGREGLIDNQCAKVFRQIVEGILQESAHRFFGTQSDIRAEKLEEIRSTNRARRAKEEQRKLAKKRRDEFRRKVRDQIAEVREHLLTLQRLQSEWAGQHIDLTEKLILGRRTTLAEIEQRLHELDVGDPPQGLQSFQTEYNEYSLAYKRAIQLVGSLSNENFSLLDELKNIKPVDVFEKERLKRQRDLEGTIGRFVSDANRLQTETAGNLREIGREQLSSYVVQINAIYREVMEGRIPLSPALKRLDDRFRVSRAEIETFFRGITAAFEALRDNIDLNAVATSGMDDLSQLREELAKLNALAQLGITVEIIGHELESLDASISRGLSALPKDVQTLPAFQSVMHAHHALTDRLRFLSPLKLSGEQSKEWITGSQIANHIEDFFGEALARENITLSTSESFAKFRVFDRRSRIFPVFINLVNNSRYWLAQKKIPGGRIAFSAKDSKVIVADDGPGVADDDVKNLFTLFFTRKARGGRGVGLYLCRTNLAAGGHQIHYGEDHKERVLPGANFVMEFLGAEYA